MAKFGGQTFSSGGLAQSTPAPAPTPAPFTPTPPPAATVTPGIESSAPAAAPAATGAGATTTKDQLKASYPDLAWLMDTVPEIVAIVEQAIRENWSPQKFADAVRNSAWYRSTSDSTRDYLALQATDPATFQQELGNKNQEVRAIVMALGYADAVDDGWYDMHANTAMRLGLSGAALQRHIADDVVANIGGVRTNSTLAAIKQTASAYGFPLDGAGEKAWQWAIDSGRNTLENFRALMVDYAKSLFPWLSKDIESGLTLDQITNPFRGQIANLLEVDPGTIDFTKDAKWMNTIAYTDPKTGTTRKMSAVELETYVRSMPEWRKTRNAKDEAANMGQQILESFGAVA